MILDVYRVTTYRNVHRILILIILGSFVAWKTFAIVSRFMSRNGCCCCCCCCCCTQKIILHLSAKLFSIQKFSSAAAVEVVAVVDVDTVVAAFAGVTVVVVADVVAAAVTIFYLRCLTSRQMVSLSPFSLL